MTGACAAKQPYGCPRMRVSLLLLAALAATTQFVTAASASSPAASAPAGPVAPPPPHTQTRVGMDALAMFDKLCISTAADRTKVQETVEPMLGKAAEALSEGDALALQGRGGGAAWSFKTGSGDLVGGLRADGVCEIRFPATDLGLLQQLVLGYVTELQRIQGYRVATGRDEGPLSATVRRGKEYLIQRRGGRRATLTVLLDSADQAHPSGLISLTPAAAGA